MTMCHITYDIHMQGDDDLFLKACQNPNNVEQVRGLLEGGQTVHVARSSVRSS